MQPVFILPPIGFFLSRSGTNVREHARFTYSTGRARRALCFSEPGKKLAPEATKTRRRSPAHRAAKTAATPELARRD